MCFFLSEILEVVVVCTTILLAANIVDNQGEFVSLMGVSADDEMVCVKNDICRHRIVIVAYMFDVVYCTGTPNSITGTSS